MPDRIVARHMVAPFHIVFIYDNLSWIRQVRSEAKEVAIIAVIKEETDFKDFLNAGANDFLCEGSVNLVLLQKSIQLALERKSAELNYDALFYEAPTPMCAFDPKSLQIELVNNAAVQHYGYSEEEFLQLKITDLSQDQELPRFLDHENRLRPHKQLLSYEGECAHRKKNGEVIFVEIRGRAVKRNRKLLWLVAIQDITEEKQNFELITHQQEQLKLHIVGSRMFSVDINYRTREVKVSDEAREVLGRPVKNNLTIDELIETIHADDRGRMADLMNNFSPSRIRNIQFRVVGPNGRILWLERRPYIYYDDTGQPIGTKGLMVDITDQKQTELELARSFVELQRAATQQASILNALPAHIALLNADGIIVAVNERWKDFGEANGLLTPESGLGMSYFAGSETHDDVQKIHDQLRAVLRGELNGFRHEYACHSPSTKRWFAMITSKLEHGGGAVVMHVDITDQALAEAESMKAQANLTAIFNTTEDAFVLISTDYTIMAFNKQAATNATRYFNQEYKQGASFLNYVKEDIREDFIETLKRVEHGDGLHFHTSFSANQEDHWYKIRVQAVRGADNRTIGYCISGHNFTEQKQVELKLRTSEERFRALIENSGEFFTIANDDGAIKYASPNVKNTLGNVEVQQRSIEHLIHPEEIHAYRLMFTRVQETPSRIFHYIHRVKDHNGEWRWIEGSMVNLNHLEAVQGIVANFRDITARVNVELELKKSEYFLKKATTAAKLGYWILNLTDHTVRWSAQVFEIFGMSEKHTAPTLDLFYSSVHPDDLPFVRATVEDLIVSSRPGHFMCRILIADGTIRWINVDAEFSYDESGIAHSMLGIAQDITDLKDKEEHLRVSKNNLDSLINSSQDLIWAVDAKGKLMSANRVYQKTVVDVAGVQPNVGEDAVVDGSIGASFWREQYDATLSGAFLNFEYSFREDNRVYDIRLNPILDGAKIIGLSGYGRDITEAKRNADVIKRIYGQYEILSRATNDAVWDWDIITNQLTWNHGLEHLFGHKRDASNSNLNWWVENVHPDDRDEILRSLDVAIAEKRHNWSGNYRIRCADGNYKYVYDRAYTVYENGVPVRMIGAMQDIDELTHYRKSLEQKVAERTKELHASLAKEKELADMKNRFVSIASHEFRTPLATIDFATGFLRSYRHKVSDEEVGQKLATIEKQVTHMASLLEDVLALEKTEVGKIKVLRNPISLQDVMNDVCESVERLTKYSHKIRISWCIGVPEYYTDEKLLRNIFSNLLTNAIKFSPGANEVMLDCQQSDEHLTFSVTDKGIGINSTDLENIFEPFMRGSNATTIPGTGLGLSIVKRTVDLLGGTITVRSKPGETKFEVTLPKHTNEEN